MLKTNKVKCKLIILAILSMGLVSCGSSGGGGGGGSPVTGGTPTPGGGTGTTTPTIGEVSTSINNKSTKVNCKTGGICDTFDIPASSGGYSSITAKNLKDSRQTKVYNSQKTHAITIEGNVYFENSGNIDSTNGIVNVKNATSETTTFINKGNLSSKINSQLITGILINGSNGAINFYNDGTITNKYDRISSSTSISTTGITAKGNNVKIYNRKNISFDSITGISLTTNAYLENTGLITGTGTALDLNKSSKADNYGNIKVNLVKPLLVTSSNYALGIGVYNDSVLYNTGNIEIIGYSKTTTDEQVGILVSNNSTFINNGTIKMTGKNVIAIRAINNSTVKIGENSQIILNNEPAITQANTNFTNPNTNNNTGGKAYDISASSTLINAGTISSTSALLMSSPGRFVLASSTGKIVAPEVILENDIYIDSSATLDSAKDSYQVESIKTKKLSGAGEIISESVLFDSETTKVDDETYAITLNRKNFKELFSGDLGTVLENDYVGSDSSSKTKELYNSLKALTSTTILGRVSDELTGNAIISNSIYNESYKNNVILKKIDESMLDYDIQSQGLTVQTFGSKLKEDTTNKSVGFDLDTTSVLLTGRKMINENLNLGIALGYMKAETDFNDDFVSFGNVRSTQDSSLWTVAGTMKNRLANNLYLNSKLGLSFGENETERYVIIAGNQLIEGKYDSFSIFGSTVLEYNKQITDRFSIKPMVGLSVINTKLDGYTEKGLSSYNLKVDSTSGTRATLGTGIKADFKLFDSGSTSFSLSPNATYSYDIVDPYENRKITIGGLTSGLEVESRESKKSSLDLGLNLNFNYNSLSISGGYTRDVLSDGDDDRFNIGVKFSF